jgi:hypothetical protein
MARLSSANTRRKRKRAPKAKVRGEAVIWPRGLEQRYGISAITRWRWERGGHLPPRDVNVGGKTGWKPSTLTAADSPAKRLNPIKTPMQVRKLRR